MIYECCNKEKIRFEIEAWLSDLKSNELLDIKITNCKVLKGTYNLIIRLEK